MKQQAPKRAVALGYERDGDGAPRVLGSGRGELARRILELASEHDIPVHEDADLVELLGALDVGAEIPADLYAVIAELLAYLYRLNAELS